MAKRGFRKRLSPTTQAAAYPTLERFDSGRRDFLTKLGLAVIGGSLVGCGGRAINQQPDLGQTTGAPPMPDAGVDHTPHEVPPLQGEAPLPDARVDRREVDQREIDPPLGGGAPMPDARIGDRDLHQPDAGKTDNWAIGGDVAPPDARVDR